jgi:hypothetical protein
MTLLMKAVALGTILVVARSRVLTLRWTGGWERRERCQKEGRVVKEPLTATVQASRARQTLVSHLEVAFL